MAVEGGSSAIKKVYERAPEAKYDMQIKWDRPAVNSMMRNTGFSTFSKDKKLQRNHDLVEKQKMPGPGTYNSHYTEFF